MQKVKYRRHESFSIRDGWIEKGIESVAKYGNETFHKEKGIRLLGIGANMVKSLKYWMLSADLIKSSFKCELTDFSRAIQNYDPYMETDFSWSLVHYNLSKNFKDCPVEYFITNILNETKMTKEIVFDEYKKYCMINEIEFNERSVLEDIKMYFKMYVSDTVSNPEDNFNSPLSKLGLLEEGIERGEFVKTMIDPDSLSYYVVYYCIQELYKEKKSFNLNEIYNIEKSPLKIFNLEKGIFLQYLNILKNKGFITINKTAGLNTVYLNKHFEINELYSAYFGGITNEL